MSLIKNVRSGRREAWLEEAGGRVAPFGEVDSDLDAQLEAVLAGPHVVPAQVHYPPYLAHLI